MKLILHPGHAKCGSTSIQNTLVKNRKILAAHNCLLPDDQLRMQGDPDFNPRAVTPRPFFRQIMESGDTEVLYKRLAACRERQPAGCMLISAENLVNELKNHKGRNIHQIFVDFFDEFQVIYYIKRQDAFILSAWQQWGYKGGVDFQQYMKHCLTTERPNYLAIASFLSQLYGETNVSVIPLHDSALHGGDLITDFFTRIGIKTDLLDQNRVPSNRSLNPLLCNVLSRSPHLFRDMHDERIKGKLTRLLGHNSLIFSRFPAFVQDKDRLTIMNHYDEQNKQLHNRFFKNLDFDLLFGCNVSTSSTQPTLSLELEKITSLLAIQNEMLIKLIEKL